MGIYQESGNWYGNVGKLPRLFLCENKTLVATVDPSELLGPPGSSLLWSITQDESPLVEVLGSLTSNAVMRKIT